MSKYKYLLWDMDGTILDFHAAEKAAIKSLFSRFNLGECDDEMIARYSAINKKYWEALERGEMTKPEILVGRFVEFFANEGIDVSVAPDFNSAYQIALGDTIVYHDNAKDILLEEKGKYTLVLITNGTKIAQDKKLKATGMNEIFDYIFISEVVGFEKPSKAYFDRVFDGVGIENLDEVLVIGDSLTSDIKGGLTARVDTCWYNPEGVENNTDYKPTFEISDLHEVAEII